MVLAGGRARVNFCSRLRRMCVVKGRCEWMCRKQMLLYRRTRKIKKGRRALLAGWQYEQHFDAGFHLDTEKIHGMKRTVTKYGANNVQKRESA